MCREDIRIGRNRFVSTKSVPFNLGNPVRLCGPAPNRVCISVSAGNNIAAVFARPDFNTNGIGLFVNTTGPLLMRIEDYGQIVTEELLIDGVSIQGTAYLVEVFYDDGEYP